MNSGGAHCLKYGVTTNNVLGLKMVLMDGEVVEIGGSHLDSEGYDLLALIVGSEGQFGIVTEATVRILAPPRAHARCCSASTRARQPASCVSAIIASASSPWPSSSWTSRPSTSARAFAKAGYPLDVEALLIVEVEGSEDEIAVAAQPASRRSHGRSSPKRCWSAAAPSRARKIWKGRKAAFGAIGRISDYYCMDGTIPLGQLPEVLVAIAHICGSHGLKVANIFHAGDGNLHPLILYDANDPQQSIKAEEAGAEILRLCVEVGGCLTGEHGVGIEKRDLMGVQFSETDLALQMRIKTVFDPTWLLNPAKVFPLSAPRPQAA